MGECFGFVERCIGHQLRIVPCQTSAWFGRSLFRTKGHFWQKKIKIKVIKSIKNCFLRCCNRNFYCMGTTFVASPHSWGCEQLRKPTQHTFLELQGKKGPFSNKMFEEFKRPTSHLMLVRMVDDPFLSAPETFPPRVDSGSPPPLDMLSWKNMSRIFLHSGLQ